MLGPRENFKNLVSNFFGIDMRSLLSKLEPSSFQTEEGERVDGHTLADDIFFPADPL